MRRFVTLLILVAVAFCVESWAEDSSPDALSLIKNVASHYSQSGSYRIEAVEERTTTNELDRNWEKILLTAMKAPNGRYRYEARTGHGSSILVSDGKTNWAYHVEANLYTQSSTSTAEQKKRVFYQEEMEIPTAKGLVAQIETLASRLKSAKRLADERLEINGSKRDCYVVTFANSDLRSDKSDMKTEETIWITKSGNAVVKSEVKRATSLDLPGSNAHIPIISVDTITYTVTELDTNEPDSSFSFNAPKGAKLVESFPEPRFHRANNNPVVDLLGKVAPDVSFKAADGSVMNLSAFRGQPIFIEFWATWCAPCIELLPELKKLHEETAPKGLVWISIDSDEDAGTATAFLSQDHIPWTNYHDAGDSIGKAFGRQGIPLAVLIDAGGKVTFYKSGYDMAELRAAIAELESTHDAASAK